MVALNNLAYLTAVKDGNADEGLRLAEAAIEAGGPHPELLDTRATVLLKAGNSQGT